MNCPNVVRFYGTIETNKKMLCIVTEYCPRGSLYSILNNPAIEIGWNRVLKFAIDMVTGLEYLHSLEQPVLHRNLKSSNLMVTQSWRIKLADFSISRLRVETNLDTLKKSKSISMFHVCLVLHLSSRGSCMDSSGIGGRNLHHKVKNPFCKQPF